MAESKDTKPSDWEDNLKQQQDEVVALQSIYEADLNAVQVLCNPIDTCTAMNESEESPKGAVGCDVSSNWPDKAEMYVIQVYVPVNIESGALTVEAWLPCEHDVHNNHMRATATRPHFMRTESGRRWHSSFQVNHLPPFNLQVTLPGSYPSIDPPIYTLSSLWLGPTDLSALCVQLDGLWQDSQGMPILYTWTHWLSNEALKYLGYTSHIQMSPYVKDDESQVGRDPRALPECTDLQHDLVTILRYDFEQECKEFCQNAQTCSICFDEKLGSQFFRLNECRHHFCRKCMTSYCQMHVKEGTVNQLSCPDPKCEAGLPVDILRDVLEEEQYKRWETLQLQKALDSMGDVTWCPRCMLPVIKEADDVLKLAHCTTCIYSFCTACMDPWHQGTACATAEEKMADLESRSKGSKNSKNDARRIKQLQLEYLSTTLIKKISKPCPACKADIEKYEGCNKVVCTSCRQAMCWVCGAAINGYEHFKKSSKCGLLDNVGRPFLAYRPQREVPEAVLHIAAELLDNPEAHARLTQCPRCRQRNLKEGLNNHLRCWSCKSNFCYLCGQIIDKLQNHFVGGQCQQHSV